MTPTPKQAAWMADLVARFQADTLTLTEKD